MKKNRVALILVLFVVVSCPVFSDQENCIQTQEYYLGLVDGRMHSPWVWGLLGFGLTTMGSIADEVAFTQAAWYPTSYRGDGFGKHMIGPGIGTAISIALPLAITPRPKVIPANISEDQLNCYLDGYKRTARPRIVTRALIGCAAGWGGWFLLRMVRGV